MSEHRSPGEDAYARAGVCIDEGERLVSLIKPAAAATRRPGIMGGLGGFGALFDLKAAGWRDPILVSGTDGVGTKLRVAIDTDRLDTIGIDLVAMCVNDILAQGAEPLFFLDYFACGKLDADRATKVVKGIAEGCRLSGCALVGGETAEMPGMYHGDDFDLAGFAVGAVEREAILPKFERMKAGDKLIGLASSGAHANGFSLIRRIVAEKGLKWTAPAPFETDAPDLAAALLAPTALYVTQVLPFIRSGQVKGLAHITGGGLIENPPRMLPEGLACAFDWQSWPLPPLFGWLQQAGELSDHDLRRTFNCGIGLVICVAPDTAQSLAEALGGRVIGELVAV
jgi:phosphoribosylaminoimidazole synthetase